MFVMENELLMFYPSLLQELLRTNTVEINLFLYAENKYVRPLQQLLYQLGYLSLTDIKAFDQRAGIYDQAMLRAIKKFNQKHKIAGDGARLKAYSLWRMIQTAEILPHLKTLQSYTGNTEGYLQAEHYLYDPLLQLLSYLDFKEDSLQLNMEKFCTYHGLIFQSKSLHQTPKEYLINTATACLGEHFNYNSPSDSLLAETSLTTNLLKILETPDNKVSINDGQIQLVLTKKEPGVYWNGNEAVGSFLERYPNEVNPELSPISLKVIEQVARNEGKLDAINTYDQAFLSIGIFQWTLGTGSNAGELPALLFKLKTKYPLKFNTWFVPLGIGIDAQTDSTTGFMTYQGERIANAEQKEIFRSPSWAFHFWKALMQPEFQAIQVEHAHDRFKNFYFKPEPKGLPYPLYQMITSSYGVALLLDQHINRPGWLNPCLGLALAENMNYASPDHWGTEEESKIIESYLKIRATYSDGSYAPMTAANNRANQIGLAVQNGSLSKERGSFEYLVQKQWDGFGMKGNSKGVSLPPNYNPADYPDIW